MSLHDLEAVFAELSALPTAERERRLTEIEQKDPASATALRALLATHDQLGARGSDLRREPTKSISHDSSSDRGKRVPSDLSAPPSLPPGALVGHFEIVRLIGGGSAAEVYEARRIDPVSQRVALKILRPGMGSIDLLARFEEERETLAQLDHPGIASIIDAGATTDGRPWFAMPFVDGVPITRYCDDDARRLSIHDRVALLREVCDAIAYAHRRGVVHRDLTPANILVTEVDGVARPVVVDFGIAKALSRPRRVDSELHVHRKILGTPAYMAPEQTRPGAPLGSPADVFGIGSLMAELFTGSTPLDIESLETPALDQVLTDVRLRERPSLGALLRRPPPEARAAVAVRRGATSAKLARLLHGELQWIVSHCLELDPDRRYESAAPLADDLVRWLRGELPSVGPRSRIAAVRSFMRRHRAGVAIAALFALVLASATVVSFLFAASERRARQDADERALELELVSQFQADMLRNFDVQEAGRRLAIDLRARIERAIAAVHPEDVEHRQSLHDLDAALASINPADAARSLAQESILQPAERLIEARIADQPLVAAELFRSLGESYSRLGVVEQTVAMYAKARTLIAGSVAPGDPRLIDAMVRHAGALQAAARHCEAEPIFAEVVAHHRRHPESDVAATISVLRMHAFSLLHCERHDEGLRLIQEALALGSERLGADHPEVVICLHTLGQALRRAGHLDEAIDHFEHVLRLVEARPTSDQDAPFAALIMMEIAYTGELLGNFEEAERMYRRGWEIRRRLLGDDHNLTWSSARGVADMLRQQGDPDGAIALRLPLAERVLSNVPELDRNANIVVTDLIADYDALEQARPGAGARTKSEVWSKWLEEWRRRPWLPPPPRPW